MGIGLIALLIALNVTLLVLFVTEVNNGRNALRVIKETGEILALLRFRSAGWMSGRLSSIWLTRGVR